MYCQQPKDIEGEPAVHVLNKGADPITCDMEDPALIVTNTFDGAVWILRHTDTSVIIIKSARRMRPTGRRRRPASALKSSSLPRFIARFLAASKDLYLVSHSVGIIQGTVDGSNLRERRWEFYIFWPWGARSTPVGGGIFPGRHACWRKNRLYSIDICCLERARDFLFEKYTSEIHFSNSNLVYQKWTFSNFSPAALFLCSPTEETFI